MGYVFRDRYYSQPIISRRQLYNCIVYIHRNPVKADIVRKCENYKYSSYNEFYGKFEVISEKSIELLFETSNNYIELFEKIHKNRIIEDIDDIQDFIDENRIITDFLKTRNKNIKGIKEDREELKKLLIMLRERGGLSLRRMSDIFDISKDTINVIIKS